MIALARVIERFGADYLERHRPLPSQQQALERLARCRTPLAPTFTARCSNDACAAMRVVPHSCGHRHCPHCQHHESQRWIERQRRQLAPGPYFLLTFTLPAQLRLLAWAHQRLVYAALMESAWRTIRQFAQNHRHLRGCPGAVGVLHTHSRALEFHPHVHLAMPAAALDAATRQWRQLPTRQRFLFSHKALAAVFRGKLIEALKACGLTLPVDLPERWVVDCKRLDHGGAAIVYLGRYLYRGVIQERDILGCDERGVTYRWRDSKSGQQRQRTVPGAEFLRLVLQHVLPQGLRRARSYGFLHPNARQFATLLKLLVFATPAPLPQRPAMRCTCCGAPMRIVLYRTPPPPPPRPCDRSTTNPAAAPPRSSGGTTGAQA